MTDLERAIARHRPQLLRHCYRMMGSFAEAEDALQESLAKAWRARESYRADSPVLHWLMRIATNTCLNELAKKKAARALPQLDLKPASPDRAIESRDPDAWVTPAPDTRLFPAADDVVEARETVAVAFIALLQRLSPNQRAVLLLKDVVGWSSDEIASALETSTSSVSSALHRAREAIVGDGEKPWTPALVDRSDEPPKALLEAYVRAWESHDLDRLVRLLKRDVVFTMPPHASWFFGADNVAVFLRTPRFASFWERGLRAIVVRANGAPALAWYHRFHGGDDDVWRLHSIHAMRFVDGALAEATNFIGPHYLAGFDVPDVLPKA